MLSVITLKENGCCVHDPVYFEQAWDHKDELKRNKWRQAIEKERDDMMDRKVWTVVENVGQKYIPLKWVFKVKDDGRYRARLVALGYRQVAGIDYDEIHAPVISDVGFRLVLYIGLQKKLVD